MKLEPTLPYVSGSDTSKAAAESHAPASVSALKSLMLRFIAYSGGATCDEIEASLGLRHQTASARIKELKDTQKIRDTGTRRRTRSGRMAAVYEVVKC